MRLLKPRKVGNVHAFFNGRIFIGPDWTVLLATLCFIVGGSLLFVCYTNTKAGARIVVGIFAALSLGSLLHCGLRDPGICPKAPPPPADAPPHEPVPVAISYTAADGSSQSRVIERRWCYSCHLYRPIRSVHCRFCDVCVCRRDHHCPWTGTCIGAHNYLSYFTLVWCSFVMVLTALVGGIVSLANRAATITAQMEADHVPVDKRGSPFLAAIVQTWGMELLLLAVCVPWAALVGSLATYHTHLVLHNRTSGDDAKQSEDGVNYYDRGSVIANIRASFFPPLSVMYDGSETLADSGAPWAVVVEEAVGEELLSITTSAAAAAERARRREDAGAILMYSAPTAVVAVEDTALTNDLQKRGSAMV